KGYGMERYRPAEGSSERIAFAPQQALSASDRPALYRHHALRLRSGPVSGNRATGTISDPHQPNRLSPAHPGLTCLGAGETVSPPSTILTLPPRPERYLIRPPCEQT
ncbi:hypothetical protein, partial [Hyphomonas beringensis]|uniref:hypothetical protein n=1 Tax=Hyphomonas beringensis TaxID=1280946 RepID=UPI0019D6DF63